MRERRAPGTMSRAIDRGFSESAHRSVAVDPRAAITSCPLQSFRTEQDGARLVREPCPRSRSPSGHGRTEGEEDGRDRRRLPPSIDLTRRSLAVAVACSRITPDDSGSGLGRLGGEHRARSGTTLRAFALVRTLRGHPRGLPGKKEIQEALNLWCSATFTDGRFIVTRFRRNEVLAEVSAEEFHRISFPGGGSCNRFRHYPSRPAMCGYHGGQDYPH